MESSGDAEDMVAAVADSMLKLSMEEKQEEKNDTGKGKKGKAEAKAPKKRALPLKKAGAVASTSQGEFLLLLMPACAPSI